MHERIAELERQIMELRIAELERQVEELKQQQLQPWKFIPFNPPTIVPCGPYYPSVAPWQPYGPTWTVSGNTADTIRLMGNSGHQQ